MHLHRNPQLLQRKKEKVKNLRLRRFFNLSYPDATPYAWAFHGFYDAKEFLKDLSNRDDMVTIIGGTEYRPFSNLRTKWLKDSEFSRLIWVIRIDINLDGTNHCFPMEAHLAFDNKIARGIISQNIWEQGEIDVVKATLTKSEARDLDERFSAIPFYEGRDAIFHKAIKAADSDLEDLI